MIENPSKNSIMKFLSICKVVGCFKKSDDFVDDIITYSETDLDSLYFVKIVKCWGNSPDQPHSYIFFDCVFDPALDSNTVISISHEISYPKTNFQEISFISAQLIGDCILFFSPKILHLTSDNYLIRHEWNPLKCFYNVSKQKFMSLK